MKADLRRPIGWKRTTSCLKIHLPGTRLPRTVRRMPPWITRPANRQGKDSHPRKVRDMRIAFLRPHLWETCLQRKIRRNHQLHPRRLLCGPHSSFLPGELIFRRRIRNLVNGHSPVEARAKETNAFQPRVQATLTQLRDCRTRQRAWERHPGVKDHYPPSATGIRQTVTNTPAANWTWEAVSQSRRFPQRQDQIR
jgi:hypothetical protein